MHLFTASFFATLAGSQMGVAGPTRWFGRTPVPMHTALFRFLSFRIGTRLGGGTFVLLLPLEEGAEVVALAHRVQDTVEPPLSWQGHSVDLSVSVGRALFPTHAGEPDVLLRLAEQALYESKPLRQHRVPAQRLQLELTETGLLAGGSDPVAVLRKARCDLVQGYLVARPMATEAFEAWRLAHVAEPVAMA